MAEDTAKNPPGPSAGPSPPSAVDDRSAEFQTQLDIASDLLRTFSGLVTAGPNATQAGMLDQSVADLRAQRDALAAEIETLEETAAADSSPFIEDAPAVTGLAREKIFTLQDYILFILVSAYGFAVLTLLLLIGKRTGWAKGALLKTVGGAAVITGLLYILLKRYA